MKSRSHWTIFDRRKRRLSWAMGFVSAFFVNSSLLWEAHATCVPDLAPPTPPNEAYRDPAELLYTEGEKMLSATPRDYARALDFFMKSRAIFPSPDNSLMAAMCLWHLGREPEALALYEEILTRFNEKLEERERQHFRHYIEELKKTIVIAYVSEKDGFFSIDGDACGVLPRAAPIYLKPGRHRFRVIRTGNPEGVLRFLGEPGTRVDLILPIPKPPQGHWFVQVSGGPMIGGSLLDSPTASSTMTGFLIQTRDGYRFPNQLSLGLAMGMFYATTGAESLNPQAFQQGFDVDRHDCSPDSDCYFRERVTFAPFMGISAAWEPRVDKNFDALLRVGFGLLGAQSKSAIEARKNGLRDSVDALGIVTRGREVEKSAPPYASFEMGLMWRMQRIRIGLSVGAFFMLPIDESPKLKPARVIDPNDVPFDDPVPAYGPSFLFAPQLLFGFDP